MVGGLLTLGLVMHATMSHSEKPLGERAQKHHAQRAEAKARAARLGAPFYKNTVMPDGDCQIDAGDGLPAAFPAPEFPAVIPFAINPHYGGHIVVRGRDAKLYHKYQRTSGGNGNWTDWKCLTPDLTKIPCSSAPKCNGYDNNPVIAVQPKDGTLVVFVRQMDDLDIHEMHLTDPKDPESWCPMRAPTCLCNFPPCNTPQYPNQTRCGTEGNCDNKGVNCNDAEHQPSSKQYWSTQPTFPTSELVVQPDTEGRLQLFFRGFDGNLYMTRQGTAGDPVGKYTPPMMYGINAIVE